MLTECGTKRLEILILFIYDIGVLISKTLFYFDKDKNPLYYLFIKFVSHFFRS